MKGYYDNTSTQREHIKKASKASKLDNYIRYGRSDKAREEFEKKPYYSNYSGGRHASRKTVK